VKTTRKPSKNAFFQQNKKKHKKMHIECKKMTFFEICLDEISYNRPYLQVCTEKKVFEKKNFLEKSPVQPQPGRRRGRKTR